MVRSFRLLLALVCAALTTLLLTPRPAGAAPAAAPSATAPMPPAPQAGPAPSATAASVAASAAPSAAPAPPSPAPAPSAERPKRMESVRYRKPVAGSNFDAGGAWILVNAPLDVVRKVVQRFDRYDRLIPRLEQSRVVARRHGATDVYMRAPVLHGAVTLWAVIRFNPIEKLGVVERMSSELVEGNLLSWNAEWRLIPCGEERTLIKLEILTDVNIPFPSSLIAPELAYIADKAVTAVRDRAECAHRAHGRKHSVPPLAPLAPPAGAPGAGPKLR
jgi:hypothetical protein